MPDPYEIESQGDHQYVVHLRSSGEVTESWFYLTPSVLEKLGGGQDEEGVVRRTVEFLLQFQDVADFPDVVELEDVIACYDGYIDALTA